MASGEFLAGEVRFAGSVRELFDSSLIEIYSRESVVLLDMRRAGVLLNDEQLELEAFLKRELDELLAPENCTSSELAP